MLTDPYIFFASGEPGYTLHIPVKNGQLGVVAGDILLSDADTLLRNQRLGSSGVAFLFDDEGRIVAHPRMSALIGAQSPGRRRHHIAPPDRRLQNRHSGGGARLAIGQPGAAVFPQ